MGANVGRQDRSKGIAIAQAAQPGAILGRIAAEVPFEIPLLPAEVQLQPAMQHFAVRDAEEVIDFVGRREAAEDRVAIGARFRPVER